MGDHDAGDGSGVEDPEDGDGASSGLSRRRFIGLLGGGAAAAAASGCLPSPGDSGELVPVPDLIGGLLTPSVTTLVLRRREDMMRIRVRLVNLVIRPVLGKAAVLVPRFGFQESFIVFDFGSQHTAEAATQEGSAFPNPPVGSRAAGPSRLAFRVPAGGSIPFTLPGLLDWDRLIPSVVPAAVAGFGLNVIAPLNPARRAPTPTETAIELPWRLILSTHRHSRWHHEVDRRGSARDAYELWHTMLDPVDEAQLSPSLPAMLRAPATVRAVWSPDLVLPEAQRRAAEDGETGDGKPFPYMSIGSRERAQVVEQTSFAPPAIRRAIEVRRLGLSALGGWADLSASWPEGVELAQWIHKATMGRDHYVKLVKRGWLFPYGHRALKIVVTERKFGRSSFGGPTGAHLRQREFLVVLQRHRRYAGGDSARYPGEGRDFPFRSIECLTEVTPDATSERVDGTLGEVFRVVATGAPLALPFLATDWQGNQIGFTAPIAFHPYGNDTTGFETQLKDLARRLDEAAEEPTSANAPLHDVARPRLPGEAVALAPDGGLAGSTDMGITVLGLGAAVAPDVLAERSANRAPFVPRMVFARGHLPQAGALSASGPPTGGGGAAEALGDAVFGYFEDYVEKAFEDNVGQVFAEAKKIADQSVQAAVDLAKDTATGLLNGALEATGLSRTAGMVLGPLDQIRQGRFDPAAFAETLKAKLLGVVSLQDVLEAAEIEVPQFPDPEALLPPPPDAVTITHERSDTVVKSHLRWEPRFKSQDDIPGFVGEVFRIDEIGPTTFVAEVHTTADLAHPDQTTSETRAELTNVRLQLLPGVVHFLTVDVKRVAFSAGTGKKPDVDLQLGDVTFTEELAFIAVLADFLTTEGPGPAFEVSPAGVEISYAAPLPSVQLGMFALQNLSFSVSAVIPFTDAPIRVGADFGTRDNPFLITIAMFSGGGWVSVLLESLSVVRLDAGLEFGGSMALDIGVASGGASLMAGVYIVVDETDGVRDVSLTGFVRLNGELCVLGLITISAEFCMSLTYHSSPSPKVHGEATLKVAVKVLMVSKSVELHVSRTFSSTPGDPTFADLMPPRRTRPGSELSSEAWDRYCAAFAPLEVA